MGIVVDTNVFIDVDNGRISPRQFQAAVQDAEVFVSAISISELLVGVHLAKSTELKLQRSASVDGVIAAFHILDFTEEVARVHAAIYADFLLRGARAETDSHDIQIAATAIAHQHTVLTSNQSDFDRIPGISVISP